MDTRHIPSHIHHLSVVRGSSHDGLTGRHGKRLYNDIGVDRVRDGRCLLDVLYKVRIRRLDRGGTDEIGVDGEIYVTLLLQLLEQAGVDLYRLEHGARLQPSDLDALSNIGRQLQLYALQTLQELSGHSTVRHIAERVGDRQRHGKHVLVLHEADDLVAVGDDLVTLSVGLQHLLDDVGGDRVPVRLAVFLRRGWLQVLHDVALAVARCPEPLAAVGTLEGLGTRV